MGYAGLVRGSGKACRVMDIIQQDNASKVVNIVSSVGQVFNTLR